MNIEERYDCGFQKGNKRFRFRTGAICVNDGKMLFVKCGVADYYYMAGGAVQMGEDTESCIEREFFEETGINAKVSRLAVICENFFKGVGGVIDGCDCHTLEFYYCLNAESSNIANCKRQTDTGEELVWLPIEEIAENNIKPTFLRERITEILRSEGIIHIVEQRDR